MPDNSDHHRVLIRPATPKTTRVPANRGGGVGAIYASSRAALGDEIFTQLHPDGLSPKRARSKPLRRRIEWISRARPGDRPGRRLRHLRLDHDAKVGEIGNNAVDPACRGRGIGAALYRTRPSTASEKKA